MSHSSQQRPGFLFREAVKQEVEGGGCVEEGERARGSQFIFTEEVKA